MKQVTVRLRDPELAKALERRAAAEGRSLNGVIIELLRGALGVAQVQRPTIGAALDRFCGDMPAEEADALLEDLRVMEDVDDGFWS